MFDEPTICLLAFDENNLDRVKGWDGFISPEGLFYKVIERDKHESPHDPFVEALMRHKKIDLKAMFEEKRGKRNDFNCNMRYKVMLINLLGYVSYDYHGIYSGVVLGMPDPYINGKTVTFEQFKMIERLIDLNNDSYLNTISQLSLYAEQHGLDDLIIIKSK